MGANSFAAIDDGLIGYWPLDGDALDYSVNQNDGALLIGASFVDNPTGSGQVLQSKHGPANTGHVQVGLPSSFHPGEDVVGFTASGAFWVMFDDREGRIDATNYQALLGEAPGVLYVDRHLPDNRLWTMVKSIENGHSSTKNTWPKSTQQSLSLEGRWYHIAWTFHSHNQGDEGHFRWYIDGVINAEHTYGLQTKNTSDFRIGADYANYPSNSKLAEVRIYNRILTAEEVTELASLEQFNPVPTYPAWWGIPSAGSLESQYAAGIPAEDYSPALLGQLEFMTSKARDELDAVLAPVGGAGAEIDALADAFVVDPTDASPANLGQLKHVSSKFFNRFAAVGFTPGSAGWPADLILDKGTPDNSPLYPWMDDSADAYSPALLGQLKYLYNWELVNFDLTQVDAEVIDLENGVFGDGVGDLWEYAQFGDLSTYDGGEDTTAPIAPIGLAAPNIADTQVELVWTAGSDDQSTIVGYQVIVDGSVAMVSVSPFAALSALVPNTTYAITVKAVDSSGNVSAESSPLSVTTLPASSPNTFNPQLIAGFEQSAFLKEDGTLWSWGSNEYNSLGFGPSNTSSSGVNILEPFAAQRTPEFTKASIGKQHGLGVDSDGKIYSWGYNSDGKLGHGSTNTADSLNEPTVISGLSSVVIVDAFTAEYSSVAVDDSGEVWSWGANNYSQLGRDTSGADSATPARVELSPGVYLNGVEAVSGSSRLVAALKTNGEVWTWGYSDYLGLGNLSSHQLVPQQVSITAVDAIAVGKYYSEPHTLALKSDGSVWGWGDNDLGQLGNGNTGFAYTPVRVQQEGGGYLSNVVAIAAGDQYSLALKSDGTVWSWGYDYQGRLGYDVISDSKQLLAKQISGLSGITQIAAGSAFGLAAASDGSVYAWGFNSSGQLGDATLVDSISPQVVVGFNWSTTEADAPRMVPPSGSYSVPVNTYATSEESGSIRYTIDTSIPDISDSIWNPNDSKLIDTAKWLRIKNFNSLDVAGQETSRYYNLGYSVSAGYNHSFVLTPERRLHAWGRNSYKQTGLPASTSSQTDEPIELVSLYDVSSVAGGELHSLALLRDGSLYSWGYNGSGRLGHDSTSTSSTYNLTEPTLIESLSAISFVSVSVGTDTSFALSSQGEVWSWGESSSSQLGRDSGGLDSGVPAHVEDGQGNYLTDIQAIRAGVDFAAALSMDGSVWTWGEADYLGLGNLNSNQLVPQQVPIRGISAISVGKDSNGHTLALKSDGRVWAWGYNGYGQLGNDTTNFGYTPVPVLQEGGVALDNVVVVSAGEYLSLALKADGTVWSWGSESDGRLGYDVVDDTRQRTAKQVLGLSGIVWIDAGLRHGIAVDSNGVIYTWGDNYYGQLGLSGVTTEDQFAPVIARISIDTDADGLDQWFETLYGVSDPSVDEENGGTGDGLSNLEEFLAGTSPIIADTDGDGLLDGDELYADGSHGDLDGIITDPLNSDSDFDGMFDGEEVSVGLNPNDFGDALDDIDGDRYPNVFEFRNGMDPELSGDDLPISAFVVDASMGAGYTHSSIQSAVDASIDDFQVILVRDGRYFENVVIASNDPLMLVISENGALNTIIDDDGQNQYLPIVRTQSQVVIDGFTLTGLEASSDNALEVTGDNSLFTRLIVDSNETTNSGIIYVSGDGNRFERSVVADNTAYRGAGFYLTNAINTSFRHLTVVNNHATTSSNSGYGMYVSGSSSSVVIESSIFWNDPDVAAASEFSGSLGNVTQVNSVIKGGFGGASDVDPQLDQFGYLTSNSPTQVINAAGPAVAAYDIHMELSPFDVSADVGADEWIDNDNGNATGDTIPDWWEILVAGDLTTLSASSDYDGDSVLDSDEYVLGLDPINWEGLQAVSATSPIIDSSVVGSRSLELSLTANEAHNVSVTFYGLNFDVDGEFDFATYSGGDFGNFNFTELATVSQALSTGNNTVDWDGVDIGTGQFHRYEVVAMKVTSTETDGGGHIANIDYAGDYIDEGELLGFNQVSFPDADGGTEFYRNGRMRFRFGANDMEPVIAHHQIYPGLWSNRLLYQEETVDWLPFTTDGKFIYEQARSGSITIPESSQNYFKTRSLPENTIIYTNQNVDLTNYSVEAYRSVPSLGEVLHGVFSLSGDAKVTLQLYRPDLTPYPLYYFNDGTQGYDLFQDLVLAAGDHDFEFVAMNYENFQSSGEVTLFDDSNMGSSVNLVNGHFRVKFIIEDVQTGKITVQWASVIVSN